MSQGIIIKQLIAHDCIKSLVCGGGVCNFAGSIPAVCIRPVRNTKWGGKQDVLSAAFLGLDHHTSGKTRNVELTGRTVPITHIFIIMEIHGILQEKASPGEVIVIDLETGKARRADTTQTKL